MRVAQKDTTSNRDNYDAFYAVKEYDKSQDNPTKNIEKAIDSVNERFGLENITHLPADK